MVNFHDFKTPLDQKNKILSKINVSFFLFNVCCILISEADLQFKSAVPEFTAMPPEAMIIVLGCVQNGFPEF